MQSGLQFMILLNLTADPDKTNVSCGDVQQVSTPFKICIILYYYILLHYLFVFFAFKFVQFWCSVISVSEKQVLNLKTTQWTGSLDNPRTSRRLIRLIRSPFDILPGNPAAAISTDNVTKTSVCLGGKNGSFRLETPIFALLAKKGKVVLANPNMTGPS